MPDILLQGLVLPAEPTAFTIFPNGDVYDFFADYKYGTAVQLPQHGDLIDRSELLEKSKVHGMYPHWIDTMDVKRAPVVVTASEENSE